MRVGRRIMELMEQVASLKSKLEAKDEVMEEIKFFVMNRNDLNDAGKYIICNSIDALMKKG